MGDTRDIEVRQAPAYGTPNVELIGRWLELDRADDGPFWALNLMKYRDVADYGEVGGDRVEPALTGREADDRYAPLGPLAAIGAMVAFHGDVVDQLAGAPRWDRVGVVRYPSRASFFAMQQREDFKRQHVHKEAGMERTIVLACRPHTQVGDGVPRTSTGNEATTRFATALVVERGGSPPVDQPDDPVVLFDVEGVIVGDERRWDRAWFCRADEQLARRVAARRSAADEVVAVVLQPELDRLLESVATTPREDVP